MDILCLFTDFMFQSTRYEWVRTYTIDPSLIALFSVQTQSSNYVAVEGSGRKVKYDDVPVIRISV